MHLHHTYTGMLTAVGLLMTFTVSPAAVSHAWPVYQGDAIAYTMSNLPNPMLVYVFASDGQLVGLINEHGHTEKATLERIAAAVERENFKTLTGNARSELAGRLVSFLLDQGYHLRDILKSKSKYTLLIAIPKVKKSDCQRFRGVERQYEQSIRRAIQAIPNGTSAYSVVVLALASPKVQIKCAG